MAVKKLVSGRLSWISRTQRTSTPTAMVWMEMLLAPFMSILRLEMMKLLETATPLFAASQRGSSVLLSWALIFISPTETTERA